MKRIVAVTALAVAAFVIPSASASAAPAEAACHGQFVSGTVQSLAGSGTTLNDVARSLGFSNAGELHQALKSGQAGFGC